MGICLEHPELWTGLGLSSGPGLLAWSKAQNTDAQVPKTGALYVCNHIQGSTEPGKPGQQVWMEPVFAMEIEPLL